MLGAPLNLTTPNFRPATEIAGGTPPDDGFFDNTATFRGAIKDNAEASDWTVGWTAYPAN